MTQFYYNETKENHYKMIESVSKEGFADHIIVAEQETGPIRMWHCKNKDGSSAYSFRVVSGPWGFLAIYGDVGENILRAFGARDTVSWICGAKNSTDYVIQKIINKHKGFMPAEASALLQCDIDDAGDDEEKQRTTEFANKVLEYWSPKDDWDSEQSFINAYLNAGGESECIENVYDWDSNVYWTVMCLRKFVELYEEKYKQDGPCSSYFVGKDAPVAPRF